jgi:hypothetical protein
MSHKISIIMKKTLFITISLFFSFVLKGQDAKSIIESSRDAVKVSSFEAVSSLTIKDSKGNVRSRKNTMASKTFSDNTEKRIIKFISPAEVKGTGILIFDNEVENDDMWIYLPAMRKTRRIVSSEKSKSFMGSEFSNADMTAPTLEDFSYSLLGEETVDGAECWKITTKPVSIDLEDVYGYSKSISWIGKNDYIVRKTEYYDYDDELFKTIVTLEYKLLDEVHKKYMITDMSAENFQNGRSSRMKMDQVQIANTKDEYFTVAYLER